MFEDESVEELAARIGMNPDEIWVEALALFHTNANKYRSEHPNEPREDAVKVGIASAYLAGLVNGMEMTIQRN